MSEAYSEDRLVQKTTADYFHDTLRWESVYAYNDEVLGRDGTLGRSSEKEIVLTRYLRAALEKFNPGLPEAVYDQAIEKIISVDAAQTTLQTNHEKYKLFREGVPVLFRAEDGDEEVFRLQVFEFDPDKIGENHFLVVRELWVQGRIYRRRPDVVGFVNGIPLLFIELKKHHKNLRVAYEDNLSDYRDTIPEILHHNAFIILSNGIKGRMGSLTSKYAHYKQWKRLDEDEEGRVDFETMLMGICNKATFMNLFENFILYDDSKGEIRKIIAHNHQYLGVNRAFAAIRQRDVREGKLGVFWHTQGAGKSYSMAFLSRKVHRKLPGNFSFLVLTDRKELDDQIHKTIMGVGETDKSSRATSGPDLEEKLKGNPRYVFSLIQKFNLKERKQYSDRSNIIVFSDEAHRTQYGLFARRMRSALPNAAYLGFTGTPLMGGPEDELTKDIFGDYISVYDFQRAWKDGATVRLYYDNRGEKLDITVDKLNEKIADVLESHELDEEKEERVRSQLSKDYVVITSDKRLDRIAEDFVAHYTKRWQTGKAMIVCIDKITTVRLYNKIERYWQAEIEQCKKMITQATDEQEEIDLENYLDWLEKTERLVIISEDQNEVKTFRKWGLDIEPHRKIIKDPKRNLEEEFKEDDHPFRVAIVCAMWLTGFDVESLATMYIDKPMKMHTLMQTIARANRVHEGKHNGLIVDYNGMVKSLRKALAVYTAGRPQEDAPSENGDDEQDPVPPEDGLLEDYKEALQTCVDHLAYLGYDLSDLIEAQGFDKLFALERAAEGVCLNDETRARFEVLAREAFKIGRSLVADPRIYYPPTKELFDAIDAIYKQIQKSSVLDDISDILIDAYRVVDKTITVYTTDMEPGADSGKVFDISKIDTEKLIQEFSKSNKQNTSVQALKERVEQRLERMVRRNPLRVDFAERYQKIVDEYNYETDRVTVEKTFEDLLNLVEDLTDEDQRAAREGLTEEYLAIFDLICEKKNNLSPQTRNKVKAVAKDLIEAIKAELSQVDNWREKEATQAQVRTFIYNYLYSETTGLPVDAYTSEDVETISGVLYQHVYQRYPSVTKSVYLE